MAPMPPDDLDAALNLAVFEKIQDEEPYYVEIPGLQGVWATGRSLEDCRRRLKQALEDWAAFPKA